MTGWKFTALARRGTVALALITSTLALVSCGGSGGSASNGSLGGVAATGAPMGAATITVTCAAGPELTSTTSATGSWSVNLDAASALPCIVKATGGTPPVTLYSLANSTGNVNVTPLTNLVVAAAAGSDPGAWVAANAGNLSSKLKDLANNLPAAKTAITQSLTDAGYTLPSQDFMTASFTPANGDPLDDLLEAVAKGVTDSGMTYADLVTQVASAGTTPLSLPAPSVVAFDSIPGPFPANMPSYGPEAYALTSLGDLVTLAPDAPRKLRGVTVAMSSWACQSGGWNTADCMSAPGTTFEHPITLRIYNANGSSLLASKTQTFAMPYRPSSDASCGSGRWKAANGTCYNGYAFKIAFDLSSLAVTLPDTVLYKLTYNTRTAGEAPLGNGGPYDSLNMGVYDSTAVSPTVGSDPDAGMLYWNGVAQNKGAGLMARFEVVK